MLRSRLLAALALALVSPLGTAQSPVHARLFTRTEGKVVRAAIPIEIDGAWHIYHQELGHPQAIGQPTQVTFLGEGIEWGPVRFPEPVRLDQSDVAGPGTFILAHEHELVLYAAGTLTGAGQPEALQVKLKGLVCEDIQGCIPFKQTLDSEGAGDDDLFAAFPADLLPASPGPGAAEAPPAPSSEPSGSAAAEEPGARDEQGENAEVALFTRAEGGTVRAALRIELDPEWHLYHTADDLGHEAIGKPTTVTLGGTGVRWETPRFPAPIRLDQSDISGPGAYINAHEGELVVYVRGTLEPGARADDVSATVDGQVCDPNFCVNFHAVAHDRGRGPDEVWSGWDAAYAGGGTSAGPAGSGASVATSAATGTTLPPASGSDEGLLLFLLLAVGGGLFALVMPCTYPMIPITISFFTKQAEKRGGNALSLSLAYGAGIVVIFVVVGVLFGSLIKPFASHPVTNLVLGLAFVYFSLVLFGALNLEPPRFLMNAAGTASSRGGFVGVFLMGATLVVTSFTCTAPFVGSLLSVGATGGSALRVALGMTVFGLTMAVPFVLLSLVPGRLKAMPRSGEWMNTVKVTLGFVELAAALKFISNTDLVWHWGWLSRELFLTFWAGIFLVAGLYLFGLIHLKTTPAPISPGRMLTALAFTLFALYCWNGTTGSAMDPVMTAILPNYSSRPTGGGGAGAEARKHAIVIDDYAAARGRARAEGKLVLLNFTGYT